MIILKTSFDTYPYTFHCRSITTVLLWQSLEQGDRFILDHRGNCVQARDLEAMRRICDDEMIQIAWDEVAEIDFDYFWRCLEGLSPDQETTEEDCDVILNGWNFIEDLLRSLKLTELRAQLNSPVINKFYDKIFYGNNLPAMTPAGMSYEPLWEPAELLEVRNNLRDVWSQLGRKSGLWLP